MKEWRETGRKEGREEGRKEGKEEGREEGREGGREEGGREKQTRKEGKRDRDIWMSEEDCYKMQIMPHPCHPHLGPPPLLVKGTNTIMFTKSRPLFIEYNSSPGASGYYYKYAANCSTCIMHHLCTEIQFNLSGV